MDPWYDGKYDGIDGRKMAVGAYGRARNYGQDGPLISPLHTHHTQVVCGDLL